MLRFTLITFLNISLAICNTVTAENKVIFKIKPAYDIIEKFKLRTLIKNFASKSETECLLECSRTQQCFIVTIISNVCNLYDSNASTFLRISNSSILYSKIELDLYLLNLTNINGLINYWPIINNGLDIIGDSHINFTSINRLNIDRFNKLNSSLVIKSVMFVPPSVYFNGDYTITLWVNLTENGNGKRFIHFSNGIYDDSVGVFPNEYGKLSSTNSYRNNDVIFTSSSTKTLNLGKWNHISVRLNGKNLTLFTNGEIIGSQLIEILPRNVTRYLCQFGQANASIDDIKIYNKALTDSEIMNDYYHNNVLISIY